ncbi:prolyl oligopeptidase family serine peptidase [Dysgonomonas sp. 520]|uniref:prolyl oligopeptidase family serine peptidase n=1 Tax=Dysgonomonas sp. 520 TaxID=2302931 RepID=UPI0013D710EC|nr:hypothetical protein [Dysgonomonas sp. 520]
MNKSFKILIGQDGTYDLENNFPNDLTKKKFFGSENMSNLNKISAINNIPSNPPATFLIHGTADTVISKGECQKFGKALKKIYCLQYI